MGWEHGDEVCQVSTAYSEFTDRVTARFLHSPSTLTPGSQNPLPATIWEQRVLILQSIICGCGGCVGFSMLEPGSWQHGEFPTLGSMNTELLPSTWSLWPIPKMVGGTSIFAPPIMKQTSVLRFLFIPAHVDEVHFHRTQCSWEFFLWRGGVRGPPHTCYGERFLAPKNVLPAAPATSVVRQTWWPPVLIWGLGTVNSRRFCYRAPGWSSWRGLPHRGRPPTRSCWQCYLSSSPEPSPRAVHAGGHLFQFHPDVGDSRSRTGPGNFAPCTRCAGVQRAATCHHLSQNTEGKEIRWGGEGFNECSANSFYEAAYSYSPLSLLTCFTPLPSLILKRAVLMGLASE